MIVIQFLKKYWAPLAGFLSGLLLMFYMQNQCKEPVQTKTKIVEKIVEKEKIVYKKDASSQQKIEENKNVETRIITRADGTTETIIIDKTTSKLDSSWQESVAITQESSKTIEKTETHTSTPVLKQWRIGASAHQTLDSIRQLKYSDLSYQIETSRRVLGPVWGSLFYTPKSQQADHHIGVGFSLEF